MSEANWTVCNDGLDIATVDRGVTAGIAPPPGGGSYIYGFNSLAAVQGAVGLFVNGVGFAPMSKGCLITGAIQRGPGGGATGFSPFLFAALQGPSVNDSCYMLGLEDDDPHHIVLRKGTLSSGVGEEGDVGVLRASDESFAVGTWVHLRLDVVVNPNGDVVIDCWKNDLSAQPLGDAPSWQAIDGMSQFIDDHLGVNSGSQPFTSGRAGFGFSVEDVTRRGFFDHIELWRQL